MTGDGQVLIVRAWTEAGELRIRFTPGTEAEARQPGPVVTTFEEAWAFLRQWMEGCRAV